MRVLKLNTMARGKEDQGSKHKINFKEGNFNYFKKNSSYQ